jgi:hypothetical protein
VHCSELSLREVVERLDSGRVQRGTLVFFENGVCGGGNKRHNCYGVLVDQ